MTNIDALRRELESVRSSTKSLDQGYWKRQNDVIAKQQAEFAVKSRKLQITPDKLKTPFTI